MQCAFTQIGFVISLAGAVAFIAAQPAAEAAQRSAPAAPAKASQSAAAGVLPDVVGFRPGLSLQEAYNQLKAYDIRGQVQGGQMKVPEISDKPLPHTLQLSESGPGSAEVIQLELTLPPSKQVVWRASRSLLFGIEKPAARSSVLAALREKYGQEFSFTPGANVYYWFFDEQGRRVAPSSQISYRTCATSLGEFRAAFETSVNTLRPSPYDRPLRLELFSPAQLVCRSLVVVVATLSPGQGPDLVNEMTVAVADVGVITRARQATYDLIASVQAKQRKGELEKAQQQKPKL